MTRLFGKASKTNTEADFLLEKKEREFIEAIRPRKRNYS